MEHGSDVVSIHFVCIFVAYNSDIRDANYRQGLVHHHHSFLLVITFNVATVFRLHVCVCGCSCSKLDFRLDI